MSSAPLTITLSEICTTFRRCHQNGSRYVRGLVESHGFPEPLPGQKPRLWSRAQVEAWFRDPLRAAAGGFNPANDAGLDPAFAPERIAAAQASLSARYGAR